MNDTIELMRAHTAVCANEIEFAESESLSLSGYPVLIHQLVMNLILNAAEAIGGGGEGSGAGGGGGKIRFRATPMENGVCLIAEDNGPGIPLNNRQKILGAFFTTKASGTGLGLLSVRSCVDIHDGSLKIGDSELGGAKFIIELPNLTTDRIRQLRSPEQTARIQAPVFEALEH
ncbi:MAG: ATP-binding protein [Proteobacteria bacterium]|nr:MAG: ATP-binding protein [Pseudomonadota bacterium]